jgi:hypothetical protein
MGDNLTFIRCLVAGVTGLVVGGVSGFALSFIFIITPLQRVLGSRYSEFDIFGVIGVTIFAALLVSRNSIAQSVDETV